MTGHADTVPGPGSMGRSQAGWIAWSVVVGLAVGAALLRLFNLEALLARLSGPHWWAEIIWWNALVPLGVLAFATVGAMIIARDPRNRIGWLALGLTALLTIHDLVWQYAIRSIHLTAGPLPLERLAIWLSYVVSPAMLLLGVAIMLLHFPNGRLVSARWRPLIWMAIAIAGFNVVSGTVLTAAGGTVELTRPSALTGNSSSQLAGPIHAVAEYLIASVLILTGISIVVRWRSSSGIDRKRLKWIAYVGALIGFSLILSVLAITLTGDSYISFAILSLILGWFTVGIPLAIGIAILRHQLFDIDIVINRTLVYGTLTIILGTGYVLSVLALQALFGQVLGGQDIAIVIATLLAVAAARPVRDRIQRAVDRRFFRQKYDASNTLMRLRRSIGEEIDLERLERSIVRVVAETLQPDHVSIWVSDPARVARPRVAPRSSIDP